VIRLEDQPELWSCVESLSEKPSRLRGHSSLAAYNLVDSLDGNTEVLSEADLCKAQWLEELLLKNHSRVGWNSVLW